MSDAFLDRWRVTILAGVILGGAVGGLGGRLAMMALRFTSSTRAHGVVSDDGFVIGRFTLRGSYNLLVVSAAIGIIGAAVHPLVARWLIGPSWFRNMSSATGSGVVVGSMLVHSDGVDFTLLGPHWFAVLLFVALPALFGGLIGPTRCVLAQPGNWFNRGIRRWLCPGIALACLPPTILVAALVGLVSVIGEPLRRSPRVRHWQTASSYGVSVRAAWLGVAGLGLVALVHDANQII